MSGGGDTDLRKLRELEVVWSEPQLHYQASHVIKITTDGQATVSRLPTICMPTQEPHAYDHFLTSFLVFMTEASPHQLKFSSEASTLVVNSGSMCFAIGEYRVNGEIYAVFSAAKPPILSDTKLESPPVPASQNPTPFNKVNALKLVELCSNIVQATDVAEHWEHYKQALQRIFILTNNQTPALDAHIKKLDDEVKKTSAAAFVGAVTTALGVVGAYFTGGITLTIAGIIKDLCMFSVILTCCAISFWGWTSTTPDSQTRATCRKNENLSQATFCHGGGTRYY